MLAKRDLLIPNKQHIAVPAVAAAAAAADAWVGGLSEHERAVADTTSVGGSVI